MTKQDNRVKSTGHLDHVRVDNQTLTIEGWAASEGAGRAIGLEATVSGKPCRLVEQVLQLPSPDVRKVFPALDDSDHCRFVMRVTLPEGLPSPIRDLFLAVEPSFAQGTGRKSFWHSVASSLPDPPQAHMTLIGDGFREAAFEFLDYFVDKCGLSPTDNVLDVGCGVGRMTYALVTYLESSARYEGFDIIPDLIAWAQQEISARYPNFQFRQAPIYNSFYNPAGHLNPTEFIFPYQDASFEFFLLTSVFTHMPGDAVRHYMHEIRRVLKPGGHGLMTCFLLNRESISLIQGGKSGLDLSHPHGDGMVANPGNPDYAVGFDEELFKGWLKASGLEVVNTLYGSWCGRSDHVSYQDLLIVQG
jgi:SAM-dependent methyltransferase